MTGHVGLHSVPDDKDLAKWLRSLLIEANEEFLVYFNEWQEVVEMTEESKEPEEWAYARLLNNLATLDQPKLIRLFSAAIWRINTIESL